MFRINYVEVSVLAMFTSIALFFGTKNIPVSLTLAALSYFTLLASLFSRIIFNKYLNNVQKGENDKVDFHKGEYPQKS